MAHIISIVPDWLIVSTFVLMNAAFIAGIVYVAMLASANDPFD